MGRLIGGGRLDAHGCSRSIPGTRAQDEAGDLAGGLLV
jgi:hypothetical protein